MAGTKPYNANVEIRTCHDVRKLAACFHCKGLGDKRHMVPIKPGRLAEYVHGRCYIQHEGMDAFLALHPDVTDTLYLDDIGDDAMKALMEQSTVLVPQPISPSGGNDRVVIHAHVCNLAAWFNAPDTPYQPYYGRRRKK